MMLEGKNSTKLNPARYSSRNENVINILISKHNSTDLRNIKRIHLKWSSIMHQNHFLMNLHYLADCLVSTTKPIHLLSSSSNPSPSINLLIIHIRSLKVTDLKLITSDCSLQNNLTQIHSFID